MMGFIYDHAVEGCRVNLLKSPVDGRQHRNGELPDLMYAGSNAAMIHFWIDGGHGSAGLIHQFSAVTEEQRTLELTGNAAGENGFAYPSGQVHQLPLNPAL